MTESSKEPVRLKAPPRIGRRGALLLVMMALGVGSALFLGLRPLDFVPRAKGDSSALSFFLSAFTPAFDYEGSSVPADAPPFLWSILTSLGRTVSLALVAMSLAFPLGLILGLVAAKNPSELDESEESRWSRAIRGAARTTAALLRSVHELLWAVLLLAALGLGTGPAVLALALPYAGILAKIFAELIEESSPGPARGLRQAGAGRALTFFSATLPTAAPDMAAYTFYRLECAVRSAAVLGFFGLPTIGMRLQASFASRHYREVWTELFALFLVVLVFEAWSGWLRRGTATVRSGRGTLGACATDRVLRSDPANPAGCDASNPRSAPAKLRSSAPRLQSSQDPSAKRDPWRRLLDPEQLFKARPKERFLRGSLLVLGSACVAAWVFEWKGLFGAESLFEARRIENLKRFVTVDLVPLPLRTGEGSLYGWLLELWSNGGAEAIGSTLAIALAALSAAVLGSLPFIFLGAGNLVRCAPVRILARGVCVFLRAIPELFWAFLFVDLFGAGALPAVLALALHNGGILGRLGADTAENLDPTPQRALEQAGASRVQIALFAVTPEGLPRYLSFAFYRLETCVRESTVLGLVGVVSIGWFVQDARARQRYDLVLYFVALGALLVLIADFASTLVRRWIRNA